MKPPDAAELAAQLTMKSFHAFNTEFRAITKRAARRFERRDWKGGRRDMIDRLDAYALTLGLVGVQLEFSLGRLAYEEDIWIETKSRFAELIVAQHEVERSETFFNSVSRKMLGTVGINHDVEFFLSESPLPPHGEVSGICRRYHTADGTGTLIRNILMDFNFGVDFEDIERDIEAISGEIGLRLWPYLADADGYTVDVLTAPFYRNKSAYIVGKITIGALTIPLIVPLSNGANGLYADSVLLEESEAGVLFSFAYTYFFVDLDDSDTVLAFLRDIVPHADEAELYTSLGYNRHGKTLFYRSLHRHIHTSEDLFVVAPGVEGAVMLVFTLPRFPFVFKIIKDKPCFLRSAFDTPKNVTQDRVRYQYDFVMHRDRAGRMVDTQEFENLRFRTPRFSEQVLSEFAAAARKNVTVTDENVIIHHVYIQRKVVPLPLFFRQEKHPEKIRDVLIDFGYFLKDIAASGVFPCDLYNTWNYGVTPWGRVVLFDYDDVLPIEHVRFSMKPAPRDEMEEFEPEEDWIVASDEDFFLDEMDRFSGVPAPLKGVFKTVHGDLYTLDFWNAILDNLKNDQDYDFIPFDRRKLFHARHRLT